MTWKKLQRVLACLLAVLLLSQVGAFLPTARAAGGYELQNGTAIIKSDMSVDEVNHALTRALVKEFDQKSEADQNALLGSLTWEYECEGKSKTGLATHTDWGKIDGFESETSVGKDWYKVTTYYKHPALAKNDDGNYQVRLAGTKQEVTLTKAEKLSSSITLKEGVSIALPYNDDVTVNYDELRAAILRQVVDEGTTPALTTENTEIKYKYTVAFADTWVDLDGGKIAPAVSAKSYEIQISFKGDNTYKASSEKTTVTFTERPGIKAVTKENPTFKLAFNADGEAIYDTIQQQVFDAVIQSTDPTLTAGDVSIKYLATEKVLGVDSHEWMPLTGGKKNGISYPAIGEGTQKVRISWGGNRYYAPMDLEAEVLVTGRAAAPFQLKQGVTEVAMVYNRDQSINYAETAQALREALLKSTGDVSIDEVTVQYNAGTEHIKNYRPLNYSPTGSNIIDQLVKFGLGSQTIHFVWNGNADYKPLKLDDAKVEMVDNREASAVVLKPSISIVYNMDASVMEQNIFEYVIDWDDSTLPDKSTLSADDFKIEYYAENELEIDGMTVGGGTHLYMPLAGGKGGAFEGDLVKSLTYPQMGAGEQKIRVTYKGNADYRPSTPIEGNLTVKKAKVSVKVHSTSIYAEEAKDKLGEGFITTDPADKFDIYTIYGGVTSDVTTSVFVQLPERLTKGAIITAIDEVLEGLGHKTLTQMMQEGTTVGELRKLLSDIIAKGDDLPQFVKDLLQKVGIDIDTLVKLNEALNKLPGLLDNVRVAFGTPDQAGIYTVYAITNNDNYNTGFGMGALVVKKHYSGVKLQWNHTIPNGKLTAEQAKDFDFGVTLMYNGEPAAKQTNVHYLYSGFTSKWKPYSSTTTPPTEPGRYVMTVVTVGGNYQAAPITRSFQITK